MTHARIEGHTPDWYGGELAVLAGVGAQVLHLVSHDGDDSGTADFDADGIGPKWLVIAGSAPLEYTDVDDDASTVTLAAPLTAAFKAGDPVVVWDPSVEGGGAKVVDIVASTSTEMGPVQAVIPHATVVVTGRSSLIGSSITLGEDEEPYVDQIHARRPVVDQSIIRVPAYSVRLAANVSIPHVTPTLLTTWVGATGTDDNDGEAGGAPSGGGGWYRGGSKDFFWKSVT